MNAGRSTTFVDIGSFKGKSNQVLGLAERKLGASVFSIDLHEHYTSLAGGVFGPNEFRNKFIKINKFVLGHVIFLVTLESHEVGEIWSTPIDIC